MNKVKATYFIDVLAEKRTFCSGFVYELEDGRFIMHCQDGYVSPTAEFPNQDEFNKWLESHTSET